MMKCRLLAILSSFLPLGIFAQSVTITQSFAEITNTKANAIQVELGYSGKGYGALVDTNDQEYSSYHAKRPMIVFDTNSTAVDKVHTLNEKRVDKLYKKYNAERLAKESIEQTFGTPLKYLGR